MTRANWIGAPEYYNLNMALMPIAQAFGCFNLYLVGSALVRRDHRDVDIRCIMDDAEYDRLFPGITKNQGLHPLWSIVCASISEWLANRTGLKIDFQIQRQTDANLEHDGPRSAIGFLLNPSSQED